MTVEPGLEVLVHDEFRAVAGRRIALLTHPAAVDRWLNSALSWFRAAHEQGLIRLAALLAPEHGIDSAAPDGERIASSVMGDIPVYSLYGEMLRLPDDIDLIVCDLQDVGVRYYTYLWTLSHLLDAAGERGIEVLILDRPNPLGGVVVAGAPLDPALVSLVGRYSIPIRHGMTLGELAQMINARWTAQPAPLEVIPCEGWRRSMLWEATGLPFVPPSPNMPHVETVEQYPGACLIEGTNLSEGRGTALPFEIAGAPYVDGAALADHLNGQALPGVIFRPHSFQPSASKWAGERCGGVQAHVIDPAQWDAIRAWLAVIEAALALYPDQFAWLPPGTSGVEAGLVSHFDRLIGSSEVRARIDVGAPLDDLFAAWAAFSHAFEVDRWAHLLYM